MKTNPLFHAAVMLWFAVNSCLAQKAMPPFFRSQFEKVKYFRGSSDQIILDCKAEGIPEPRYEWFKNGERVKPSNRVQVTGGVLDFKAPESQDSGYYQCFAINDHGKSMSIVSHIIKGEMEGFDKTPIKQVSYTEGDHVILHCQNPPKSVPTALVDWFRTTSNSDAIKTSERIVIDQEGSLHFINVKTTDMLPDDKTHNCSVYNTVVYQRSYGSPYKMRVSSVARIPPRKPTISFITSPKDSIVLLGQTVTLQCIPDGYPLPKVRWFRVGGELPVGRHTIFADSYKLDLSNITENDEGEYECEVFQGDETASARIFVDVKSKPIWVEPIQSLTITNGKTAEFNCVARSAIGETDAVQVKWYKNGEEQQHGTKDKMTVSGTRFIVRDVLKPYDLMSIQCNVSNTIGYQIGDGFLNVIETTKLIEKPKEKILIDPGKELELRVSAQADPLYASRLTYTWLFKGQPVKQSKYTYVNAANNLVINATELGKDEAFLEILGNYTCLVSIGLGGEGDIAVHVDVASTKEKEIIQEAALDLWWIAVIVAVVVLIIIIILICCLLYRNRGGTYPVDEKERRAGHDPEKELADSGFQDLSRADAPDEKKPYNPDQVSLTNDPPIGGDTDSLDEYGEPDSSKFNEDGSFIGNYGGRKGQQNMNQSTV